jgi:hypothetical protein
MNIFAWAMFTSHRSMAAGQLTRIFLFSAR